MKITSIQLQQLVVMAVAIISMMMFGCDDRFDSRGGAPSEEGQAVDVTLAIGLADEQDAYTLPIAPATRGDSRQAFETRLVPATRTKAVADKPDKLYNLEIIQYNSSGAKIADMGTTSTIANATIGDKLTVPLQTSNDCQLLIVARGESTTVPSIINKPDVSNIRKDKDMLVKAIGSTINNVGFDEGASMNNMPYYLYLPSVKIGSDGEIQSLDGQKLDVRLLLKRLATRLDVSWSVSQAMTDLGYILTEVRLSQVPSGYRFLPDEEDTQWGKAYPTATAEFVDLYRLKDSELSAAQGHKSVWLPANVRGTSPAATSLYYRNKQNAPTASSYLEFVVDNDGTKNGGKEERLFYRVYVGGPRTTDFNLYDNTDYRYVVNINNADYSNDARIQLLNRTPVISTNLVPTANCFMMRPGTDISFNPYKHTSGTGGWNDQLVNTPSGTPAIKTEIKKMKVLWQNKDNGTSGELVMGYAVDVNSNHQNLVNLTNGGDINQARVHVGVPVTNGGNALIAAYGDDDQTALWSWHIWVSDYVPAPLGSFTTGDATSRSSAIQAAQNATRGGMVHTYQGDSWTKTSGAFYNKVIMDRNLGAIRGVPALDSNLESARTYGVLYQWGRKDPMPGSADGSYEEINTIFNADGMTMLLDKQNSGNLMKSIANPSTFYKGMMLATNSWGGSNTKTIYDPCPDGWRVPDFYGTATSMMFDGFKLGTNLLLLNDKRWYTAQISSPAKVNATNGILYQYPGEDQNNYTNKSVWFPMYWMREYNSGELRKTDACFVMYSAHSGNKGENMQFAYYTEFKAHGVLILTDPSKANFSYGMSIRCIQDR
ncbi:hypothetical protein [uncultured Parabacteroides sp.]|uniref:DUF4906 domain-containing protein n=1 Tax=uncultured Parabacteroides sp. TaxID=512312 RepID=UPI0025EFF4F7|nr:hypothetical protein [uncultured Parabacteroides sp.]